MGAAEFILGEAAAPLRGQIEAYSQKGQRVLLLAWSAGEFQEKRLPADMKPLALVLLSDTIRKEAPDTLRYFAEQGVDIKVISGDNPVTVANIAQKAGLANAGAYVDASTLSTEKAPAGSRPALFRVRPGDPPAKAGFGQGPEGRRAHRGHDGRRRQ